MKYSDGILGVDLRRAQIELGCGVFDLRNLEAVGSRDPGALFRLTRTAAGEHRLDPVPIESAAGIATANLAQKLATHLARLELRHADGELSASDLDALEALRAAAALVATARSEAKPAGGGIPRGPVAGSDRPNVVVLPSVGAWPDPPPRLDV